MRRSASIACSARNSCTKPEQRRDRDDDGDHDRLGRLPEGDREGDRDEQDHHEHVPQLRAQDRPPGAPRLHCDLVRAVAREAVRRLGRVEAAVEARPEGVRHRPWLQLVPRHRVPGRRQIDLVRALRVHRQPSGGRRCAVGLSHTAGLACGSLHRARGRRDGGAHGDTPLPGRA